VCHAACRELEFRDAAAELQRHILFGVEVVGRSASRFPRQLAGQYFFDKGGR